MKRTNQGSRISAAIASVFATGSTACAVASSAAIGAQGVATTGGTRAIEAKVNAGIGESEDDPPTPGNNSTQKTLRFEASLGWPGRTAANAFVGSILLGGERLSYGLGHGWYVGGYLGTRQLSKRDRSGGSGVWRADLVPEHALRRRQLSIDRRRRRAHGWRESGTGVRVRHCALAPLRPYRAPDRADFAASHRPLARDWHPEQPRSAGRRLATFHVEHSYDAGLERTAPTRRSTWNISARASKRRQAVHYQTATGVARVLCHFAKHKVWGWERL